MYSPWIIFKNQVEKMFEKDPEVHVEYDEDDNNIKLFVDNAEKAEALNKILPMRKTFGNVEIKITVVPANGEDERMKYVKTAFHGNGALSHLTTIQDIPPMHMSNPITYCVFKKEVVQYNADNLGSESGVASTLYEDLAREIFGSIGGVYFCTDTE